MTRYITFLRAINVSGHNVKMEELCKIFQEIGFKSVETFIASGNVIFESKVKDSKALEAKIASQLRQTLGYEVPAFIRTDAELAKIAAYKPFSQPELDAAAALNVEFLADPPNSESKKKIMALQTDIDAFTIHEREVYWLCRKKQSDSKFSNAVLERTLGTQSTLRGMNTIRKMAEKYAY